MIVHDVLNLALGNGQLSSMIYDDLRFFKMVVFKPAPSNNQRLNPFVDDIIPTSPSYIGIMWYMKSILVGDIPYSHILSPFQKDIPKSISI